MLLLAFLSRPKIVVEDLGMVSLGSGRFKICLNKNIQQYIYPENSSKISVSENKMFPSHMANTKEGDFNGRTLQGSPTSLGFQSTLNVLTSQLT